MPEISSMQSLIDKKGNNLLPSVLHVLEEKLAVVANNLANTGTAFKTALLREKGIVIKGTDGDNISFPIIDKVIYDFSQGGLKYTNQMTNFAIIGSGFFKIKAPFGTAYTRNGQFIISSSGALMTPSGHTVLSENDDEIKIPPITKKIIVDKKGNIYADGNAIGRLGLVDFINKDSLKQKGHGLFVTKQTPDPFENTIEQGALESSNVVPIDQIVQMTRIQRHFESAQKLLDEMDKASKRTINTSSKNA
jgi:flagellar basal-body rod protein FlgF